VVQIVAASAGLVRDSLRSTVLLQRLHARRAALVYTVGCAALDGEDRRVGQARAEIRLLDELITAAGGPFPFAVDPGEFVVAARAEAPTEENVLISG
jgi:hypothetical protein